MNGSKVHSLDVMAFALMNGHHAISIVSNGKKSVGLDDVCMPHEDMLMEIGRHVLNAALTGELLDSARLLSPTETQFLNTLKENQS